MSRSSLLLINKIDLAEQVGASLEVMDRDSRKMRGPRPFLFTDLRHSVGIDAVIAWVRNQMEQAERRSLGTVAQPGELAMGGHSHGHSHPHSHSHDG